MKKRTVAILLAIVLVFGAAVGGTLAWLTDKTAEVKNTFTVGDVDITLTENDGNAWQKQMLPGKEYEKDPVVAVDGAKTNTDVYLFVKFEENNNPATYLTYTSTLTEAKGWKLVSGTTNVWWREVKTTDDVKSWNLLEGDTITVKTSVTKDNMADAVKAELIYTAYAIQTHGFATPELAWAEVSK